MVAATRNNAEVRQRRWRRSKRGGNGLRRASEQRMVTLTTRVAVSYVNLDGFLLNATSIHRCV